MRGNDCLRRVVNEAYTDPAPPANPFDMSRRLVFVASLVALGVVASPSVGQERFSLETQVAKTESTGSASWCATPQLMGSPEGQAALRRFHEARANGTLPRLSKRQEVRELGALQLFYVQSDTAGTWTPAQFELKATGTRFNIWVRTDSPDQTPISDSRIEELRVALDEATPAGSYDPTKGVFEIDGIVFGETPVYPDGSDGVVDILVYELFAGAAGFVSPVDTDPNAEDGEGNQAEILHIDVATFFTNSDGRAESVIGHELQHLIHENYDPLGSEVPFVNEGLSEYAQLLLGYLAVPPYYLLTIPNEYNVPLMAWRRGGNGVAGINDYSRASVWHGYLGDQLGPEITGAITRHPQIGLEGYKAVLAEEGAEQTVDDLIADFHTALIINDRTVDPRFGLKDPVRSSLIDIIIPSNRRFDGTRRLSGDIDSLVVEPGGVEYILWENVTDFTFTFDAIASPDLIEGRRSHARIRLIADPLSGDTEILDFDPSDVERTVLGTYKKITMVVAHVRPEVVSLLSYVHSTWSQDSNLKIASYAYGIDLPGDVGFTMAGRGDAAFAVRFPVPAGGFLNDLQVAVFHRNQFPNVGTLTEPRDYILTIWDNAGGRPGDIIYEQEYLKPAPYERIALVAYDWDVYEFDEPVAKNFQLPDTIYAGVQEMGDDENYMVVVPARVTFQAFIRAPFDTGYIRGVNQQGAYTWLPSWDVRFQGDPEDARPLFQTALPVRARFLYDPAFVGVEDLAELPEAITLRQNFPNPFNPSTRIEYTVPQAEHVQLKVYDMTGREVATLVDGQQPVGTYNVTLNATDWASGVYIYRLQAGDQQVVRRMVLLK